MREQDADGANDKSTSESLGDQQVDSILPGTLEEGRVRSHSFMTHCDRELGGPTCTYTHTHPYLLGGQQGDL